MARYYSWTIDYIDNMPALDALKYYGAIDILESREVVLQMQIMDYQRNMDQKTRTKFQKSINAAAYPGQAQKTATPEDFVKMFQGLNNGKK